MTPPPNTVVHACAGSGKTHALIERLLELLRGGAAPGDILAITFTRKAAAEIQQRLIAALEERAPGEEWARACLRRILFAEHSSDELSIYTFHSWFGVLLAGKRWQAQWYGPADLTEDDSPHRRLAWQRWLRKTRQAAALEEVLQHCSPYALKKLLTADLPSHYNAWRVCAQRMPPLANDRALAEALQAALKALMSAASSSNAGAYQRLHAAAIAYLEAAEAPPLAEVEKALLTASGSLRQLLAKDADKNGYQQELAQAEDALNHCLSRAAEVRLLPFHRSMSLLAQEYLDELEAVKGEQHHMSFDDLEYQAYRAVQACGDVNALLYRINRRFRHLLIDEFQDTSPLQWQIIHRWLQAAHGSSAAPSVFIVGDVKQAIYRFRGGDARLLESARDFLATHYRAKKDESVVCRRLAPVLLQLVNEVFDGHLDGFAPHKVDEKNRALPGRVEWRDLAADTDTAAPRRATMRNPLRAAAAESDKRQHWAAQVAASVKSIIGSWQIAAEGRPRRVAAEDILILLPQFTHSAHLRRALQRQGIACSARGGGSHFADTFAGRDIAALVNILLSPDNSLSLAQVLKSPLFCIAEEQLAHLAAPGSSLWQRLQASALPAAAALRRWRDWAQAGALPAHDLLQRIFADGDVFARYCAAVAAPYRRQVTADLSALLDFSLDNDGGRQPLLAQFVQALQAAPAGAAAGSGVQLMTVHAAKGLQAPVVIVADCGFDKKASGGGRESVNVLVDWPPAQPAPARFIFRPSSEKRAFAALAQQEEAHRERERDNLFYVALTRAQQALLVFSFAGGSNPRVDRLRRAMQAQAAFDENNGVWVLGDDLTARAADSATPAAPAAAAALPPLGSMRSAHTVRAAREGSALHQQIALLLQGYSEQAVAAATADYEQAMLPRAKKLLQTPQLQRLLQAGAHCRTEVEFAAASGIVRIDLLIASSEAVWIIDYKSGRSALDTHHAQMQGYMEAVAAAYPNKQVHAAFVTDSGFHPYTAGG